MSALEPVAYDDRGTSLTGWLARPAGVPRAAILVWPTIVNVTPSIQRRAALLAEAGYLAFIGDFYGQTVPDFAAAGSLATALRSDVDHYRTRLLAGLAAMQSLPGVAGLDHASVGYCMGGQAVLELARAGADLSFVASFHGLFTTDRPAQSDAPHKPRVVVFHGDADPLAPREHVSALWDELDAAGYGWHFHSYAKVKHGFTDPGSDSRGMDALGYDASADRQSWSALLSIAAEAFG